MKKLLSCLVAVSATLLSAETVVVDEKFDNAGDFAAKAPDFIVESDGATDSRRGNVLRITRSDKTHRNIKLNAVSAPQAGHDFTVSLDYRGIGYFFVLNREGKQLCGISVNGSGRINALAEDQNSWRSATVSVTPDKWFHVVLDFNAGDGFYRLTVTPEGGKSAQSAWLPAAAAGVPAAIQLGNAHPIGNVAFADNVKMSFSDASSLSGRENVAAAAAISGKDVDVDKSGGGALTGDTGELRLDLSAPAELSSITLSGGEAAIAGVSGVNAGGQLVKLAAAGDFTDNAGVRQADFPPATLNRVTVAFNGRRGAALPKIGLWKHRTTTRRDADEQLAATLYGEFRLPVYEGDGSAGLHLFNTGKEPLALKITLKERRSAKPVLPVIVRTLPPGETKIDFPLAALPDGEYLASIVRPADGAEMLRLLRRQRTPEPIRPEMLELSGKKLLFPNAHPLQSATGISFRSGRATAVPVLDQPPTVPGEVMRHGGALSADKEKLWLSFYTLDGNFSLKSKHNYIATAALDNLDDWSISPDTPELKMPPAPAPCVTVNRYNSAKAVPDAGGNHRYRFYNPATDGAVDVAGLEMKYIHFQQPGTLGYEPPIECEGFKFPTRTIWPIWHKEPGLSLVLSEKPFLADGYPGGLEEGFETNDNFAGSWLSEDGKSFFFAHGRVLRRYEPFNVPYDNLPLVSRIVTVFKTTDGINFTRSHLALPDESEPAGTQHYGATIFKINGSGGGLVCALVLRYFAADQRFCLDLSYSWDGLNWKRFPGEPLFLDNTHPGTWRAGSIHPSGTAFIHGDRLFWLLNWQSSAYHFYGEFGYDKFSSVTGEMVKKRFAGRKLENWPLFKHFGNDYDSLAADIRSSRITPAVMTFRPDGFFFAEAGENPGEMVTLPIRATGKVRINAEVAEAGFLRLRLLDADGKTITGSETALPPGDYCREMLETATPDGVFKIAVEMKNTRLYAIDFDAKP